MDVKSATGNSAGFKFVGKYSYKNRYHQRSIIYNHSDSCCIVKDTASHKDAILNFSCEPNNPPYLIDSGFTVNNVKFEFNEVTKITIKDSLYSPGYGKTQPSKSVNVFLSRTEVTYKIIFS